MRIAIAQMSIDPQSRAGNLRTVCALIDEAAELDPPPGVVCLPARCDGTMTDRAGPGSIAMTDTFVEVAAARAREQGISLVLGFCDTDGELLHDAVAWCDADGDVLIKHRKVNLLHDESDIFSRGECLRVQRTLFGTVGLLVGEDVLEPAIVSTLAKMGAGIVFVAGFWRDSTQIAEQVCSLARANSVFVVLANSVGSAGGDGLSKMIDPTGSVICEAGATEQEIICQEIDLETKESC